jgi:hypothetical protein
VNAEFYVGEVEFVEGVHLRWVSGFFWRSAGAAAGGAGSDLDADWEDVPEVECSGPLDLQFS